MFKNIRDCGFISDSSKTRENGNMNAAIKQSNTMLPAVNKWQQRRKNVENTLF